MSNLCRTQVYLEEEQIERLKHEADKEKLSVSELIRRSINGFLQIRDKNINWDNDPITNAIGKIKLDVTDASVNHDFYLYNKKEKK